MDTELSATVYLHYQPAAISSIGYFNSKTMTVGTLLGNLIHIVLGGSLCSTVGHNDSSRLQGAMLLNKGVVAGQHIGSQFLGPLVALLIQFLNTQSSIDV